MQVRRAVEPGEGLRIRVAGNARREIAQVAAERRQGVDLHGDDAAVAVEAHAGVGMVIARLGVGQERIGARRGPAHRPAQHLRGPGDSRDFDGKISLHAETAADVGRNDADFVLGDMQRVDRKPAPQIMRLLGRGVERVAVARRVVFAEIGARLQRIGGEPAVVQVERDDFGGAGQRAFGFLAAAALDIEHDVGAEALVNERRAGRERRARIAHAWQRLIVDRDRLGGVFGGEAAFRHHGSDDVADVAHLVAGESRPRRIVHRPAVGKRHRMHHRELAVAGALPVFGGERQQHAGHGGGGFCRDPADARVAMGAADERAPRRPGWRHVIDKQALAAQEAHILAPAQRLADVAGFACGRLNIHAGASPDQPKTAGPPPALARASSLRQK